VVGGPTSRSAGRSWESVILGGERKWWGTQEHPLFPHWTAAVADIADRFPIQPWRAYPVATRKLAAGPVSTRQHTGSRTPATTRRAAQVREDCKVKSQRAEGRVRDRQAKGDGGICSVLSVLCLLLFALCNPPGGSSRASLKNTLQPEVGALIEYRGCLCVGMDCGVSRNRCRVDPHGGYQDGWRPVMSSPRMDQSEVRGIWALITISRPSRAGRTRRPAALDASGKTRAPVSISSLANAGKEAARPSRHRSTRPFARPLGQTGPTHGAGRPSSEDRRYALVGRSGVGPARWRPRLPLGHRPREVVLFDQYKDEFRPARRKGGMGEVWLVQNLELGRRTRPPQADPTRTALFSPEARSRFPPPKRKLNGPGSSIRTSVSVHSAKIKESRSLTSRWRPSKGKSLDKLIGPRRAGRPLGVDPRGDRAGSARS